MYVVIMFFSHKRMWSTGTIPYQKNVQFICNFLFNLLQDYKVLIFLSKDFTIGRKTIMYLDYFLPMFIILIDTMSLIDQSSINGLNFFLHKNLCFQKFHKSFYRV